MMNISVEKCLHDHKNPLVKLDVPSKKFFLSIRPEEEQLFVDKYLGKLQQSLEHLRVDRRCARIKADWLENVSLAKVTKMSGSFLASYGFQDRNGKFLFPEEILFLMECNKLELSKGNRIMSIQEAYDNLLKHPNLNLEKYRVYKKLSLQGYRLLNTTGIRRIYSQTLKQSNRQIVVKHEDISSKEISSKNSLKSAVCDIKRKEKRKHNLSITDIECKIKKVGDTEKVYNNVKTCDEIEASCSNKTTDFYSDIFAKLRAKCPKPVEPLLCSKRPDYFGFLPSGSCHKYKHDFNLYLRKNNIFENDFNNYEDVPNIFATYTNDNIAFYRFANTYIPNLL